MGMTFFCAVLILGIGYLGIVKGGKLLLSNEEEPQKVTYENTSSNIFYGKIDDDIQLFPWNYYGQNEITYTYGETGEGYYAGRQNLEDVLRYVESYCWGVPETVVDQVYAQKGTSIVDSLKVSQTEYGLFFFYQDILEVGGTSYQVKAALNEWMIYSFSCMEYRQEDPREMPEWEEGKQVLIRMLDQNQQQLGENICDMQYPYNSYYDKVQIYSYREAYKMNMDYLNDMIQGKTTEEGGTDNWSVEEESAGEVKMFSSAMGSEYDEEYSYQVIELNDMILLLIQGNCDIGLYYDPISQRFCGYNFFG